jgi:hypothetical protein
MFDCAERMHNPIHISELLVDTAETPMCELHLQGIFETPEIAVREVFRKAEVDIAEQIAQIEKALPVYSDGPGTFAMQWIRRLLKGKVVSTYDHLSQLKRAKNMITKQSLKILSEKRFSISHHSARTGLRGYNLEQGSILILIDENEQVNYYKVDGLRLASATRNTLIFRAIDVYGTSCRPQINIYSDNVLSDGLVVTPSLPEGSMLFWSGYGLNFALPEDPKIAYPFAA